MRNSILYLSTYGYPSNYRKYLCTFMHEQVKEIGNRKLRVKVADLIDNRLLNDVEENYEGVDVVRLPTGSIRLKIKSLLKIYEESKNHDEILCNFLDYKYLFYSILPHILLGKKISVIIHGQDAMKKSFIKDQLKKIFLRICHKIIVVSEYTEILLRNLVGYDFNLKVYVNHNGVNTNKFLGFDQENKRDNKFRILSVCQLIERKGILEAVNASIKLLKDGYEIEHTIIGTGNLKEKVNHLIRNSGFEKSFILKENLTDQEISKSYYTSDLYIMLSKTNWAKRETEGFGISYIEASYVGLPVIAGREGGGIISVLDNFTGFLIDTTSPRVVEDVADKIKMLIDDKELYKRISENGKLLVKEKFTWNKNVSELIRILNE